MDILEIKRRLADRAPEIAEHLLPRGILDGREWCAGSVQGEPGRSLKVCIRGAKAGTWCDFAEGGDGGDLLDLWCAVKGVALGAALEQARGFLGIQAPTFAEKKPREYRRPAKPQCQAPRSAVRDYLTGRKITPAAIAAYRIGEKDRTIVFPSLAPNGDLAFVKFLKVDRTPEGKKVTNVEPGCEPILFGWQAVANANTRECTITEGELDALSAWDYGCPAPLSVPFGGGGGAKQNWLEAEFDRLAQFETIYLALDMDAEGEAAVAEITKRLGHRCRRVKLPLKDLNDCAQAGISKEEIERCFAEAESDDPEELSRAGAYTEGVINLFWPQGGIQPGYPLPFAKVGDKMRFRPAELTLWTGATGAGKSQVLSHAIIAMGDLGARACVASLEMKPEQLLKRAVKQAGNTGRPSEAYIRTLMAWMNEWVWVFGRVGKSSTARILEVFEYARCRYGCDTFVIDSLMRLGVGSEDYEGQEKAVYEMVNWAVEKGVHLHLVAHARKQDRSGGKADIPDAEDVKGASEIASNAANVISIWRNKKLEDQIKTAQLLAGKGDKAAETQLIELADQPTVVLNVAKQRNGDWEGKIGLWFNEDTYQYRSSHDPKHGREYVRTPTNMRAAE